MHHKEGVYEATESAQADIKLAMDLWERYGGK